MRTAQSLWVKPPANVYRKTTHNGFTVLLGEDKTDDDNTSVFELVSRLQISAWVSRPPGTTITVVRE